ncbi:tetratricopeptide repeat protein [uncultured Bacteroides sp.]|jgi:tetratricopeptide (TPR) repeat protein|uniref:tetratricopeptide repeat protein n=1 Tax=uncultured Bacteroides sp. TaxID=162156 RepID=UPI0026131EA2|nr:tetratricopeptide repeat protein [uncultured Bacteroides sp.]
MKELDIIKEHISQGKIEEACRKLDIFLQTASDGLDEAYYLYGNAWRKQGNWQQALNNYRRAMDLNPNSPAKNAYAMVMDILNFYNKDMYNQ